MICDSVSNIVHEFRHDLNILIVFRVTRGLDAVQYTLEVVLDPIEDAREESARNWLRRSRSNLRE